MKIERVLQRLDRVGEDVTLVGGQAVALWEHLLGLPVATETVDIDFLGDAAQARGLAEASVTAAVYRTRRSLHPTRPSCSMTLGWWSPISWPM